jgi:hypothetical protein
MPGRIIRVDPDVIRPDPSVIRRDPKRYRNGWKSGRKVVAGSFGSLRITKGDPA